MAQQITEYKNPIKEKQCKDVDTSHSEQVNNKVMIPEFPYQNLSLLPQNNKFNTTGVSAKVTPVIYHYGGSQIGPSMVLKAPKDFLYDEKMYTNEINILSKLDHPNIIKMYGRTKIIVIVGSSVNSLWCPLLEKMNFDLIDYMNELGLSKNSPFRRSKFIISLALKVAKAVQYLHSRNPPIVHRDIKPENILITIKDQNNKEDIEVIEVKLCDFGVSVELPTGSRVQHRFLSTVFYAPAEIFKSKYHYPSTAIDVYSFGCVLYTLLVLRTPWAGVATPDIIKALTSGSRLSIVTDPNDPKVNKLHCNHPVEVIDICNQCLLPDASKRPSITEVVNVLSQYV